MVQAVTMSTTSKRKLASIFEPSPSSFSSPTAVVLPPRSKKQKIKQELLPTLPSTFTQLADDGYQVITDVISKAVCGTIIDQLWTWLEGCGTGVKRDDSSTWKSPTFPHNVHGIIQHSRAGHSEGVWAVRAHPAVHNVFSDIWGTPELITSFDAVCIDPPPEVTGSKQPIHPGGTWLHTDQGSARQGRHCIQGFVTLEDIDEEDNTLCVLAGSHAHHSAFFAHFGITTSGDWNKLQPQHIEWMKAQAGVTEIRIPARAGSLVLWDSRTVHCNTKPMKNRAHPTRWRYVVYTCQAPRRFISDRDIKRKRDAFQRMRMTNHWPVTGFRLFPDKPWAYGAILPDYSAGVRQPPTLTDLGRKLAGF